MFKTISSEAQKEIAFSQGRKAGLNAGKRGYKKNCARLSKRSRDYQRGYDLGYELGKSQLIQKEIGMEGQVQVVATLGSPVRINFKNQQEVNYKIKSESTSEKIDSNRGGQTGRETAIYDRAMSFDFKREVSQIECEEDYATYKHFHQSAFFCNGELASWAQGEASDFTGELNESELDKELFGNEFPLPLQEIISQLVKEDLLTSLFSEEDSPVPFDSTLPCGVDRENLPGSYFQEQVVAQDPISYHHVQIENLLKDDESLSPIGNESALNASTSSKKAYSADNPVSFWPNQNKNLNLLASHPLPPQTIGSMP